MPDRYDVIGFVIGFGAAALIGWTLWQMWMEAPR